MAHLDDGERHVSHARASLRALRLVAWVELRRRLRNRSAIVTAFVGPLALATVFGVLLGGTSSLDLTIGVADADRSAITSGFTGGLVAADTGGDPGTTDDDPVRFVAIDADGARAAVDDGDVDAAIVLPAGFGDAITTGRGATVEVVRDPTGQVSGAVAEAIARQFVTSIESRRLAAATAGALGVTVDAADLDQVTSSATTAIDEVGPGGDTVDAASFFGVTMSIMFLFFTVSFAARSIVSERANGLVPRMLASSAPPWSVVTGKVLAVSTLGLAGFATVWAVTQLVFGASWGDPFGVVVMMTCTVFAIAGVATFVCGLARTEAQADGYTSMVAFALALLGGNFIGPGQAPETLRRIATFTPNGQAIDAFTRLAVDDAGPGDLARQIVVLVGFGVVFGALGLRRVSRLVTS
ncbi:MAG: ABC transporter permease [Acidimicrobiales bacterium]|nr:ABC transporter permease [Acidimicrobiales bacterium]